MKKSRITLIVFFSLLGISSLYLGLNIDLKCAEATTHDNLLAGLPLWIFGVYCMLTALFLWKRPQIGNILAVFTVIMATALIFAPLFNLSIPIIKTSCIEI